jgi:hypothetical protein
LPFRWTASSGIVPLAAGVTGDATEVSADGSTVIGQFALTPSASETPYIWTQAVGFQRIPLAQANGVSADGTIVVGSNSASPAYWTQAGGVQVLGGPANSRGGIATAISGDGSTVVGDESLVNPNGGVAGYPFEWSIGGNAVQLGTIPGVATAVSGNGSTIVGTYESPTNGASSAFIWTAKTGFQDLATWLDQQYGADFLKGWSALTSAVGVSADGLTIAGNGIVGGDQYEGWIVHLGTPTPTPTPTQPTPTATQPTPTATQPTPTPTQPAPTPTQPTPTPAPAPRPGPKPKPQVYHTKAVLTAKPRSANPGQTITVTATVKSLGHGGGLPTGYVSFSGKDVDDRVALVEGTATFQTVSLPVGNDRIVGVYDGDHDHLQSHSVVVVTVLKHRSTTKAVVALASPGSDHPITSNATTKGGVEDVASFARTAIIQAAAIAKGMVLPDETKASLTGRPSAPVRRVTPPSVRYGGAYLKRISLVPCSRTRR